MQSVHMLRIAIGVVIATTFTSCAYGPYPYGGYGGNPYGGSPYGTYQGGAPGYQTLPPNGTYAPGGTYSPGMVVPQGSGTGTLEPIPGGSTNAPPYDGANKPSGNVPDPYFKSSQVTPNSNPQLSQSPVAPANHVDGVLNALPGPGRQPVQPANDAQSSYNPSASSAPTFAPNSFPNVPTSPMDEPSIPAFGEFEKPIQQNSAPTIAPANTELPSLDDDPFFSTPPSGQSTGSSSSPPSWDTQGVNSHKIPVPSMSTFGHEPQFRWIRGVASKDQSTGIWSVVYAATPDRKDPYSGHLSLEKSPMLEQLSEGEIVQVSGQLEPVRKDPLGKPYFLVTSLKKVTPAP